ncbi:hypothetical protein DID74_01880 [Candidatus Marinamargulisbacteria bacterium SCGC AG-333-B06]|nr:hypothetical protein DID74_01880 [Candidatus Marinamargulisbacteria bacterium SCGC AG-333-B06]
MQQIANVIPILQDKSIYNIITYALNNNKIKTHNIKDALNTNLIQQNSLIIIDQDVDENYKKIIFKKIKKLTLPPYILLAISKNYRYFLTKPLNPLISGIIYKPFDMEELLQIIQK